MVEKVLSQELTGKKDLAFAEKFSIATANFFLNISNLYEATKEFAETMGISVEHADLWLKYIMSELETGLAGEKGGWSITYTLEKNDRTILEQELRNRFSADMLWQLFKNVDQEHHLAALQVGVKREDPEKKPEVIFAPDIRNWPLVVRVMRDNSKTLEKEINQVKALATDSKFAGKPKEEVQQIIDLKIAELKTRFQDPVTYVDVIIEKDAYQRTIAKRDPNHFMNQTVEPNPFSLIDWQGFIEGDDLPTDLEGITISEERMLTDWYIEKDLPTLTSQEQEFLSQNLKPGLTTEEIGQEVQTFSNPDFNPNHQIAFKRPDIVIGLETPTFKPAQAFYDPRVTLVLGINKETNAFTFKIPTHVPFDGLDLTKAWKETINSGIYQHFLVQESKNRAEEKNRQSGLMDTQVLPMPTWLAKRNIELGNDGGLTMAIETAMEAKPFENNGTYNFAELVGVRRAMAAIKLPDYIFTQMREFRKQSSLIEKFGDIKTSMLLMIAASLVDGRIAGTPVDPEDARLGIASMGAEIIKQLDGARSILVNNREDLEKHLVFYKSFSQWAELIKRTNNSKEAIELLNKYLEKTKPYNYAGCLESIKIIVESQDKSPSITDRKAINVFNKLILLLENNPLADEIIFRIAEFCNPPDLNSNTRPLVAVETLVEKINISDEEKRLLINEITELGSLARAQAYRLDNTNKFFFMTKAIVNGHIVTANSFEFTQGVTETNKLLAKIIEQYQTIGLVIEKIKSLLDNTSETDKYLVIGQEITTAIDTEKLEPFLNEVVLEISKIAKRAKKKVNPDEIVEKIIAIFNKKKKTLNLNQTPISPELIAALIKKINETNPGLIKNEATIIEKIYRQFELSEYDLVGLITKIDLALATLHEVTTTEFDTEDKRSIAINEAKEALLAINTTNNRYLNELKINLDHVAISTNQQIRRFVFDQRKKLFTIISHSHLISGIKYQIDSQKSQLIKEDKVGLHRFSSAVLESGAAVSNIIGKMS
ncbi:MAG: hypothetical protein IT416_01580, partial [Candidatus Pacebacteria bacterium]|nr:hypothetical protein [Candidatus Paceibacterota bacterium]